MSSRASLIPVIRDHLATFVVAGTQKLDKTSLLWHFGLPAVPSAAVAIFDLRARGTAELIGALAALAALLFGLIIFVFQLRLQLARDEAVKRDGLLATLIDELFANITYAVLAAFLALTVAVVASTTADETEGVNAWWTAALTYTAIHFTITLAMCLRRTREAYRRLTI